MRFVLVNALVSHPPFLPAAVGVAFAFYFPAVCAHDLEVLPLLYSSLARVFPAATLYPLFRQFPPCVFPFCCRIGCRVLSGARSSTGCLCVRWLFSSRTCGVLLSEMLRGYRVRVYSFCCNDCLPSRVSLVCALLWFLLRHLPDACCTS